MIEVVNVKMSNEILGKLVNVLSDFEADFDGGVLGSYGLTISSDECTTCICVHVSEIDFYVYDDGSTNIGDEYVGDSDFLYKQAKRIALEVLSR